MKRMFARMLMLALVLTMSLGCVGAFAEGEVKEVTLSMVSYRALQTEPVAWYETEVYQKIFDRIEELYGYRITVDYEQYDEDKLNLMYASGELPDIVYFYTADQVKTVLENGYALDLAPLLEEYAPTMLDEKFTQRNELMMNLAGGEEKGLYFIPTTFGVEMDRGGKNSIRGYALRWDWYKELGCPPITDDESYAEVLAQMVANHPTTEDGKTVYAFSYTDSFTEWTQMRAAFTYESCVNPWTLSGYLYSEGLDDNTLYNGYTNTERSTFWQEMRFANKLWNMGILDPDSFTQTSAERKEKSSAGQYAGAATGDGKAYDSATNPDSTAGMIVVPSEGAIFFANKIHKAGYYPDQQVFISSMSENWEAALAWVDYMHTDEAQRMLFSGIEGVHWDYVDGVPTLRQETIDMKAAGGDELAKSGVQVTTAIRISQPAELHADGYPISLFETDENRAASMYPAEIEYSEYYGVAYPSLARQNLVDEGKIINHSINYSQLTATAREAIPSDILRILTKCNDIVYRAIPDLVTAATEADFEAVQAEVLADLEAAGEPEAWAWMCEAQAAAHALVDPVVAGE